MAIILWLVVSAISFFVLYLVIKSAINNSDLANPSSEVRLLENKLNKHHQEILVQLEKLNQRLSEQNMLIRERNTES